MPSCGDLWVVARGRGVFCAAVFLVEALFGCAPIPFEPNSQGNSGSGNSGSGNSASGNSGSGGADLVLAEVAGKPITAGELERRVLERYYGPRALLGLVREALFLEEARLLGVTVPEAELLERVEDELRLVLGSTPNERQESVERLRFQGLEVEDLRAELTQELRGLLLIQKVVAAHRKLSDDDLQAAYERTWSEDRRRIRHISFLLRGSPEDEAAVAQVQTRANSIREAILSGASFAESARTFSGNPETGERGGDIGWLSREELGTEELGEFIFGLEVGTVSPLYREGDYGFHIFQVMDERTKKEFEEVRAELENELLDAPPTDEEIMRIEADLRRKIPVRVSSEVAPPG